jgi:hypothetical protein
MEHTKRMRELIEEIKKLEPHMMEFNLRQCAETLLDALTDLPVCKRNKLKQLRKVVDFALICERHVSNEENLYPPTEEEANDPRQREGSGKPDR